MNALAREMQKAKGEVKDDSELSYKPEDFEASIEEEPEEEEGQ